MFHSRISHYNIPFVLHNPITSFLVRFHPASFFHLAKHSVSLLIPPLCHNTASPFYQHFCNIAPIFCTCPHIRLKTKRFCCHFRKLLTLFFVCIVLNELCFIYNYFGTHRSCPDTGHHPSIPP